MASNVRNQRKEARALDCRRQLTLMTRANSTKTRGEDLALVGDEASERAVILIVDPANAALAERAALLLSSHCRLILVVVIVVTARSGNEIFFRLRWSTDFVLVQREQVANNSIVQPERSLVLREHLRLGVEFRDDVIAVLARADRVGELAAAPMGDFR